MTPAAPKGLFRPDMLQVCTRTVMDNTDPDITFDEQGVSNWWHDYQRIAASCLSDDDRARLLRDSLQKIKARGKNRRFDCVLGLSGGVDSSYMAYLAKTWGLRPLVVHFDNGWNDELAVRNIEVMLKALGFQLHTVVMNWPEFRDLQRAYFKASVLDLEVPTDHMIFGALYQVANAYGVQCLLSGNNFATEWLLPRAWYHSKGDLENIKGIHRAHGEIAIRNLPTLGVWKRFYYEHIKRIYQLQVLELVPYKKMAAKQFLTDEFAWRDYGGKHYESVFTRFYQGYILPTRHGIDKRKAHLSNLICNGEITRDEALEELSKPPYEVERQAADKRYVAKKLGWSEAEFDRILALPLRPHADYGSDRRQQRLAAAVVSLSGPVARLSRAARIL